VVAVVTVPVMMTGQIIVVQVIAVAIRWRLRRW
jgi:hypothetical protein